MSHSKSFRTGKTRLNGDAGTFKTLTSNQSSPAVLPPIVSRNLPEGDVGSHVSFASMATRHSRAALESGGNDKLPSWVATSHFSSRDPGCAGGPASPTSIRRVNLVRAA